MSVKVTSLYMYLDAENTGCGGSTQLQKNRKKKTKNEKGCLERADGGQATGRSFHVPTWSGSRDLFEISAWISFRLVRGVQGTL